MREFPSREQILKVFEANPRKTFRLRELVVELGLRSSQARELKHVLKELARARKIVPLKKNHFALVYKDRHAASAAATLPRQKVALVVPPTMPRRNVVTGRFIGHRDGFGFVVPDRPLAETDSDIFIPPDGTGSAMHGDRVETLVVRSKADGRLEGRIIRILERAQRTVVATFHCGARFNYVVPFDQRIPFQVVIPHGQEWPERLAGASAADRDRQYGHESQGRPQSLAEGPPKRSVQDLEGLVVDVEITSFPSPRRAGNPHGRVIEILGPRDEFGVDVEIIIRKFHLPHRFPAEALAEASTTPQFISELERNGRGDFRSLPIVTIDGETAKDFDDAVYVERLASGNYLLHVHIADVAHYVRPGTALDREARLRGTSVYFPDRAVPMLPLELSNGICSLNPQVDRLTMSVLLEIDPAGNTLEYEITPGIIRSAERMTYTAVREILAGDTAACSRYRFLVENFKLMEELAGVLNRRREQRGSIDFDLPEPIIEFDEHGRMIGITRSERNVAHRIIEEFMLAANEAVADFLERKGVSTLYRVHEKPDPKKVIEFEEIAARFGHSLGVQLPTARRIRIAGRDERQRHPRLLDRLEAEQFAVSPFDYQQLTKRIEGKPEERILSYLMLRSLKRARYSEENLGHFALATSTYTHFTSPIRRYPDLIVHRILKAMLAEEGGSTCVRTPRAAGVPQLRSTFRKRPPGRGLPASTTSAAGGAFVHPGELRALAVETSEAERRADDAECELMDWKKVAFMAQHLGDEFEALIISLTKHGFFVELTDLFVEGFVPLETLEDDCYVYREQLRAIVGQHSRNAYHLGDRLRVRLARIEHAENKLQFSIA